MAALYNLCRLSRSRIEEAATAGVVPLLQDLIGRNTPLKQFALPILCDFAHASKTCRKMLWHHQVFDLYIDLLVDPFWNLSALESILSWYVTHFHLAQAYPFGWVSTSKPLPLSGCKTKLHGSKTPC